MSLVPDSIKLRNGMGTTSEGKYLEIIIICKGFREKGHRTGRRLLLNNRGKGSAADKVQSECLLEVSFPCSGIYFYFSESYHRIHRCFYRLHFAYVY